LISSFNDKGVKIAQVRLIFSPVISTPDSGSMPIFIYGEFFKFSNLYQDDANGLNIVKPAPDIDMFVVHQHDRSNGTRMGDIIRLTDIREMVELIPRFGLRMDNQLNCNTSLHLADSFHINNFTNKETFHAILSYQ
jgi:hypothetical protein